MAAITVNALDEVTFEVTVVDRTTTTHMVTVQPGYAAKLAEGRVPVDRLVQLSFEFLLGRESNTSILRRFDLPLIANYFPEYEQAIRKLL